MPIEDLVSRAQARLGAILSRKYRLDALLGIGGMATVYAAVHLRNGNRVAVKVLHRELSVEAFIRDRFLREGYASNAVEHPGTVRVLDDDVSEDGTVFLVMELLDGETLEQRWERAGRKLPLAEVVRWTWQLLDVLAAAHARGIVHRDLKPQNLFLTRDGQLKVLDFGMARVGEQAITVTRSGAVIGTPPFMPPEQALGRQREIDARSDVWSVGATVFTLLSGRLVHGGETPEEALVHAATCAAPPLLSAAPDVPPAFAQVIDRALAFGRADRWANAGAMQEAIQLVGRDSLTLTPTELVVPAHPFAAPRTVTLSPTDDAPREAPRAARGRARAKGIVGAIVATAAVGAIAVVEARRASAVATPAASIAPVDPVAAAPPAAPLPAATPAPGDDVSAEATEPAATRDASFPPIAPPVHLSAPAAPAARASAPPAATRLLAPAPVAAPAHRTIAPATSSSPLTAPGRDPLAP